MSREFFPGLSLTGIPEKSREKFVPAAARPNFIGIFNESHCPFVIYGLAQGVSFTIVTVLVQLGQINPVGGTPLAVSKDVKHAVPIRL